MGLEETQDSSAEDRRHLRALVDVRALVAVQEGLVAVQEGEVLEVRLWTWCLGWEVVEVNIGPCCLEWAVLEVAL